MPVGFRTYPVNGVLVAGSMETGGVFFFFFFFKDYYYYLFGCVRSLLRYWRSLVAECEN